MDKYQKSQKDKLFKSTAHDPIACSASRVQRCVRTVVLFTRPEVGPGVVLKTPWFMKHKKQPAQRVDVSMTTHRQEHSPCRVASCKNTEVKSST